MASKNVIAKGTTYNGVESITLPTSPSGDATFYEISDTTATASDVLNSKYFYTAAGVKTQGTGTAPSPTLITKNITQNGTYNASSDNADGYSSVTVSVSGGGDTWSWMGKNPAKVQTSLNEKVYLKDSAFATWTPTTTQTTLVSSRTLDQYDTNFNNYDYVVVSQFHSHFEYSTSVLPHMKDFYLVAALAAYGYATNAASITADTTTLGGSAGNTYRLGGIYVNTSGVDTYATGAQYGVYQTTGGTHSVAATKITPQAPAIYARCSNTYLSTDAAAAINQNTSYYEQKIEIWRVDRGTSIGGAVAKDIRDMVYGAL